MSLRVDCPKEVALDARDNDGWKKRTWLLVREVKAV